MPKKSECLDPDIPGLGSYRARGAAMGMKLSICECLNTNGLKTYSGFGAFVAKFKGVCLDSGPGFEAGRVHLCRQYIV